MSAAVDPAVDVAWERVREADVTHTDERAGFNRACRVPCGPSRPPPPQFEIVADGSKQTLAPLYGALLGLLVSDRAKSLEFWAMDRRQICWAHWVRKFVSFAERDGPGGSLGRELLD